MITLETLITPSAMSKIYHNRTWMQFVRDVASLLLPSAKQGNL